MVGVVNRAEDNLQLVPDNNQAARSRAAVPGSNRVADKPGIVRGKPLSGRGRRVTARDSNPVGVKQVTELAVGHRSDLRKTNSIDS